MGYVVSPRTARSDRILPIKLANLNAWPAPLKTDDLGVIRDTPQGEVAVRGHVVEAGLGQELGALGVAGCSAPGNARIVGEDALVGLEGSGVHRDGVAAGVLSRSWCRARRRPGDRRRSRRGRRARSRSGTAPARTSPDPAPRSTLTCSWVQVIGISKPTCPSTLLVHAPAATTSLRAVERARAVSTSTPSPMVRMPVTGALSRTVAPRALARAMCVALALPASTRPASVW